MKIEEGSRIMYKNRKGFVKSISEVRSEGIGLKEYCIKFDGAKVQEYVNYLNADLVRVVEESDDTQNT